MLFLSSEVAPFAKTGGLGDVSAALPAALAQKGHDVRVFMPFHARIDQAKFKFRPIESLQNLRIQFGPRAFNVSVYAAAPKPGAMETFFIHCPELFARSSLYTNDADEHVRFLLFNYAAMHCAQRMRFAPDIIHCNDWQTALVPLLLRTRFSWDRQIFGNAKTVLTIHNLNYQGLFPARALSDTGLTDSAHLFHQDQLEAGVLNFLLHGILFADAITTVSPTYANEIRTREYGAGLDPFLRARGRAVVGILNGVDYGEWNPATDKHLPARYSAEDLSGKTVCRTKLLEQAHLPELPGVPLFGIVSRLAGQKGFDLLPAALPPLLRDRRIQLIVLGSGERRYERVFRQLEAQHPKQIRFAHAFDNTLAHRIEAGADFFLMPSRYEPCGLNQLYSLKYGTVPVVRKTGGLADTVANWNPRNGNGTGIVFDHYDSAGAQWAMLTATELFRNRSAYRQIQQTGMAQDFSWDTQVTKYERLYAQV